MTEIAPKPKREQLLEILDEMISQSEKMPQEHKIMSVSNYDLESQMIFKKAMFQAINEDIAKLYQLVTALSERFKD